MKLEINESLGVNMFAVVQLCKCDREIIIKIDKIKIMGVSLIY